MTLIVRAFGFENSEIEIIVNGYTELPEKYDEEIGKGQYLFKDILLG